MHNEATDRKTFMRRFTFIILTILMSSTTVFSQKISLGSEIGFISSLNSQYDAMDLENRRNTYFAGLNFNYHFSDRLYLTSGLHYLRLGYKHETCYIFEEGVKNQLTGKLDYLSIPLLANYRIEKVLVSAGVYMNFNISAKQEYPEPIDGCEIFYPRNLSENTMTMGFGGIVGLGYTIYENDLLQLNTMVKYYQGISPTLDVATQRFSAALWTVGINYKIQ